MSKISIVMPIFGVEKYIEASIQSICNQTNQNFELILVDDGSVDQSIQIACQTIKANNPIFSYRVISQENSGVSGARNTGIRASKGEWLICIDPDDTIHPQTIERLLRCVEKYGEKNSLIWFDYQLVSVHKLSFEEYRNNISTIEISKEMILSDFLRRKRKLIVPAVLVKKQFILENQLWYLQSCKFSEDVLMIWKYLYSSNGICLIDEKLYSYLHRPGSTMTSSGIEKIMTGYNSFRLFSEELTAEKPNDCYAKLIFPRWIIGALHASARMMNYQEFKQLAKQMNYQQYVCELKNFPDYKVVILSLLLRLSSRAFWMIAKNNSKEKGDKYGLHTE